MVIIGWEEFLQKGPRFHTKTAATIGVFDGLHIGHQQLIRHVVNNPYNLSPTVITFSSNPARLLKKEKYPGDLFTLRQKTDILESLGIELTILIDFSPDFSKLSGKDFIFKIIKNIDLRYLVIGSNFHCGKNAETNAEEIRSYFQNTGITVHIIEPVELNGEAVSSTSVRNMILEGKMHRVNNLLGRSYKLDIEQTKKEHKNGKIFIDLPQIKQLLPPDGVYTTIIASDCLSYKVRVSVDHNVLSWKNPDQFTPKYIEFI